MRQDGASKIAAGLAIGALAVTSTLAVQPSRPPPAAPLNTRIEATRVQSPNTAELMRRLAQRAPDMKAQIDQAEAARRAEIDRLNR